MAERHRAFQAELDRGFPTALVEQVLANPDWELDEHKFALVDKGFPMVFVNYHARAILEAMHRMHEEEAE